MFDLEEQKTELVKPVTTAVIAAAADRYYVGVRDWKQNLAFGASAGTAVFAADMIIKHTPTTNIVGKSLEQRALELGLSGTGALLLDKYVAKNSYSIYTGQRLMTVLASEIVGEYLTNSILGLA